jgi:hypothetical protein
MPSKVVSRRPPLLPQIVIPQIDATPVALSITTVTVTVQILCPRRPGHIARDSGTPSTLWSTADAARRSPRTFVLVLRVVGHHIADPVLPV